MNSALWIIPILPFVLAFFTTWSWTESITEAVWFNVTYITSLGIIYLMELAGISWVSTSPTGLGGFFALLFAFIALGVRRYRYKQEKLREAAAKALAREEAERERRRASRNGQVKPQPEDKSLIVGAFRMAAELKKSRAKAKQQANSRSQSRTSR